jgi:hypothetical protein
LPQVGFCGVEFGEETLFGLELARVNATAAGFDANWMFEVEHLVIEEILDCAAWRVGTVEDAADDDGVMSGVVVAEHATGVVGAPCERGPAEEAVEEASVERLEDFVKVVVVTGGCGEALAAAGLADVLGLFGDGLGGDVAAVTVGVGAGDGLLVELGEKDVGDGVVDGFRGRLEEVREANVEASFAKADGGVEGGEAAEADVERGDGGAGTEFAVLVFEDCDEGGGRGEFLCAGPFGSGWMESWRVGLVEKSGGCRGRRRKELQKLAQR